MSGDSGTTKLGRALAGKKKPDALTRFSEALSGARIFVPYTIPRLALECAITLVGADRLEAIEGAVHERMAALRVPFTVANEDTWTLARARLTAAEACVDLETHEPIGTVGEWAKVDPDVIADVWVRYEDVRRYADPAAYDLNSEEVALIHEALKKKEPRLLRLYGVRRLASFLLSSDVQLALSPLLTSGTTPTPSDYSSDPDTTTFPPNGQETS